MNNSKCNFLEAPGPGVLYTAAAVGVAHLIFALMRRRGIELRNHHSGVLTLDYDGEDNTGKCDNARTCLTPWSQRPVACA